MAVRLLTIFESGPTAAGTVATRVLAAAPAGRVEARGVDLTPALSEGACGLIRRVPFRYAFDLSCLRDVRRVAAGFRPAIVHAFGPLAVRTAAVLRPRRLVVSYGDRASDPFTRALVRRADAVLVHSAAEGQRYEAFGVGRSRMIAVTPTVPRPDPADRVRVRHELGLPPGTPLLIASGQFDPNAGLRFAVWAFDVVRHVYPNVRLVLIGDGPQRPRLEQFAESLGCRDRVSFVGRRADAHRFFAAADCVWLTHRVGGTMVAYEAWAAGVPVRGFGTPDAYGLPEPCTSFVPYGDPASLAIATCRVLGGPAPAPTGAIPPGAMAANVADVYDSLVTR